MVENKRERLVLNPNLMTRTTQQRLAGELAEADTALQKITQDKADVGQSYDMGDDAAFEQVERDFSMHIKRVTSLRQTLSSAEIIRPRVDTTTIGIGNKVLVNFEDEEEPEEYTLLGPQDAATNTSWMSFASPLGSKLIGKTAGDTVEYSVDQNRFRVTVREVLPGDFDAEEAQK